MSVILGLDPGGAGRNGPGNFGWCVMENQDPPARPLPIRNHGVVNCAQAAAKQCLAAADGSPIAAAGIDAPLFWSGEPSRTVDDGLRDALQGHGLPARGVLQQNSLRGACLVQGMAVAVLLRGHTPALVISESHPGVLSILLGEHLQEWVQLPEELSPHERDAAIAALSGYAALHALDGWFNLFPFEPAPISPLLPPPSYWLPNLP